MNAQQLVSLAGGPKPLPILEAANLRDRSDRTLLYGYTLDKKTHHVYFFKGNIYVGQYTHGGIVRQVDVRSNADYIPNKRLYPEACDYEFCYLLLELGITLPFTSFDLNRDPRQYHGLLLPGHG